MITTIPQQVGSFKGCTMFRQLRVGQNDIVISLTGTIQVVYDQWLITPTGDKVEEQKSRCYFVTNIPYKAAVLDAEGNIIEPEVQEYLGFDIWKEFIGVNLSMENIIIGAINNTLVNSIPIDAVDGYVIQA